MEHPERSCTTCQTDVPTGALTCPFCGAYIPEAFELDDNNDTALAGLLPTPVGEPVVQLPPPTAEEAAAEAAPVRWPAVARAEFEPPRVLVTVPETPRLLVTVPETPRVLSTEPESESPRSERPEPESPSPEAEFVEAAATTVGIEDAEGDVFDPSASWWSKPTSWWRPPIWWWWTTSGRQRWRPGRPPPRRRPQPSARRSSGYPTSGARSTCPTPRTIQTWSPPAVAGGDGAGADPALPRHGWVRWRSA